MKTSKVLLNISAFVCFVYGAFYLFTLVFIPIGIYCFIAGKRFSHKAEHIDDLYAIDNRVFKNYVIFVSIACFPLGLLSLIPFILLTSNNIKVKPVQTETVKVTKVEEEKTEEELKTDEQPVQVQAETVPETDEEKQAKFKKLQNFREKGLITDDELEMAREQLFGNDKSSEQ